MAVSRSSLHLAIAAAVLLLGLAGPASAQDPNDFVLTFTPVTSEKGAMLETATNPKVNSSTLTAAINRGTLAPCSVRGMHIHRGVDEIYFAMDKPISVAFADPSGAVTNVDLEPGTAVGVPKNTIHTVYNPDCTDTVTFLSFYNQFLGAASNVANAAFNLNAGPFKPYTNPDLIASAQAAVGGAFAFDPQCLTRCNLGAQGDQEPAMAAA